MRPIRSPRRISKLTSWNTVCTPKDLLNFCTLILPIYMIPALPGILTTKQKKSRPGSPSWAAAYFHVSIIPSILKHRQDGDDNKTPVAGCSPQKNTRPTGRPYNAALLRQIHPICHKFRLSTKFTRDALTGRPLRYRIEAMKIISRPQFAGGSPQKNTACGLVRRGFHVGSPLERFRHSLTEYDGGALRTTSYGLFSDSDAAFRRDKLKLTTTLREALNA
jgi:hypothetical protein